MTLSAGAVVVRPGGRASALLVAGMLAAAAALTLLGPVVGVVHTHDGSATAAAGGALWLMVAPALVVAVLVPIRPAAALAAGAGLGLVTGSRLFADLSLVLSPDAVARPELWVETTEHALPTTAAAGTYLLLAADVLAVAAGVVAATRLSGLVSFQHDSDFAGSTGDVAGTTADLAGDGEVHPSAAGAFAAGPRVESAAGFDRFDRMDRTVRRNNVMTVVGLLGALLLTIGSLGVPYTGGYLAARYLPVSAGVTGLIASLILAAVAATAVLVAGTLPRSLAVALLGGTALGGALPLLIAVAAVASTPTHLAGTVTVGIAGAALLTLAGLLARVRLVVAGPGQGRDAGADGATRPGRPPSRAMDLAAGVLAVLAGVLGIAAAVLPPIDAGGFENLLYLTDGSPVPGSTVFGAAAVPLLLAGIVGLVPRIGPAGRAATTLGWAGMVFAVTGALEVLGDEGLSTARSVGLISLGSGGWCGYAAAGAAVVAAALALVGMVRTSDAAPTIDDDDTVSAARAASAPVAIGVAVVAVLASCLPMFTTTSQVSSPTILSGYAVDTWGVWAILLVTLGALVAATLAGHRGVVLGLLLGAAAVAAVRLVIPSHVSQTAGFSLRPGYAVQAVLVGALAVAAVVLARNAGRITRVSVEEFDAVFLDAAAGSGGGSGSARSGAAGSRQAGSARSTPRKGGGGTGGSTSGGRQAPPAGTGSSGSTSKSGRKRR